MEDLVAVEHVSKCYTIGGKNIFALHDVSLCIGRGETLGLVGESGSGKSTLARVIMGIEHPNSGEVLYAGSPIGNLKYRKNLAQARKSQIIFQDSLASLDPRMTVESIISEGIEIHKMFNRVGRKQRVDELLLMVGLEKDHKGRYPHELSGGQRQRISIARAIAVNPEFMVCDEPISALDVSVQSHIMNLLQEFKKRLGLTYLFIAHDLNMVNYISDRIAVIYLGKIVEMGKSSDICLHARHPYTKLLLNSVLLPDPDQKSLDKIPVWDVDTSMYDSSVQGCVFTGLCPNTLDICKQKLPVLKEISQGHFCACHLDLPY